MEKSVKITPPEGYEVDKEKSTFENIVFKEIKKELAYLDIANPENHQFYISESLFEGIGKQISNPNYLGFQSGNSASSKEQLEALLALNKLINVAKYLNKDFKERKYYFFIGNCGDLDTDYCNIDYISSEVCFDSQESIDKALEILGEETIRKALNLMV